MKSAKQIRRGGIRWLALLVMLSPAAVAAPGVSFLEIPVGARENALGGAGVALLTGPTSSTYNPATVAFTPRGVALMHNRHFGDAKAQFIGFTVHRGRFAFSPSFRGTRVSDIEFRTSPSRDPIATFDATSEAVGAAVAYDFNSVLAFGVAGKYLHQKILVESSEGWSVDAGALARWPERGLTAGLALNHAGNMNHFGSAKPTLPGTVRAGAAYERTVARIGSAMVTADALAIRESAPQFRGGLELRAPQYLALRAGWVQGLQAQTLSAGFGLFIKQIQFDYAFIPYRENLGEGHRFSLGIEL